VDRSSLAVFAAARGGASRCFVQFSMNFPIFTPHSLRRTPTNSYCVRESATPPTASPCNPKTPRRANPPTGPLTKLYTLNPDASERSYTQRSISGPDKRGLSPRARTRVHHAPGPRYGGRNQLSIVTLMQIVQLRARLASCRSLPGAGHGMSRSRHRRCSAWRSHGARHDARLAHGVGGRCSLPLTKTSQGSQRRKRAQSDTARVHSS
jgi:hypothetical protein